MESFWSSLKRELVHRRQFATRAATRAATSCGSRSFTTARGSTARSVTNPLWTLKTKSTNPCLMRYPNACPPNQCQARTEMKIENKTERVICQEKELNGRLQH
jgi:hypothetical protein